MEKKTRILIVGAGKGGRALIDLFAGSDTVTIVGVVDTNPDASGMHLARKLGIPTSDTVRPFLKKRLDEIINVTGSEAMQEELSALAPKDVPVLSGHSARIIWDFLCRYRQTEVALRISREFLHTIINTIADPLFVKDREHRWIILNDAFCKFMGYSREELLGKSDYDFFPTEEADVFWEKDDLVFETEGENVNEEFLTDAAGIVHIIVTKKTVFKDPHTGGKILVGIITDITERKTLEEMWRRYSFIIDASKDFMSLVNRQFVYEAVNQAFYRGHEKTLDEIINHTVEEVWGSDVFASIIKPGLTKCLEGKEVHCQTWFHIPAFGTRFFDVALYPYTGRDGTVTHAAVITRDITEHKQLEEERLKSQKLESTGILAGGIAHDFNNFLSAILSSLSVIRFDVADQAELAEALKEAERAALRAKGLTQQLLTFSRGGAPIKKAASISELLRNTATFILSGSKSKCRFLLPRGLWTAEIDTGQIAQVIQNIVMNADQAMPEGGIITIQAENITVEEDAALELGPGRYIKISIADRGIGMPKQLLSKIFDPYFTTKQKGSGLGLATSYSIIRNHEG
ncbi:MAG: PAS domain S-box protein, partial [Candidatus Omnitrophica bacterium]|nr:PAS domain S-box protein [Candidatus Omnitrophota bacterium]